jgi:hypothetical protein
MLWYFDRAELAIAPDVPCCRSIALVMDGDDPQFVQTRLEPQFVPPNLDEIRT